MKVDKIISDKIYWHKYINFYEKLLPKDATNILEIGVFKGQSIHYWREKYPNANIFGLDIVEPSEAWPKDDRITYFKADQSDSQNYHAILQSIGAPIDILIEDGSHDPYHQKISLVESLNYLKNGSIYILEDIHTAHPHHPYYKKRAGVFLGSGVKRWFKKDPDVFMPLQCLLLIEHLKSNGKTPNDIKDTLDFKNSLFSYAEIELLFNKIKKLKFYRRNVLPDYCYACKTDNFDYTSLRCSCGTELYLGTDSMSVVLEF
jgi:hypothetical protein